MDSVSYSNLNVWENLPRLGNESETNVFTRCKVNKVKSTEVVESTGTPDSNMLLEITTSMLQKISSLPRDRRKKVLEVWEQLADGTYDIDERMDAVLDRILEDINT